MAAHHPTVPPLNDVESAATDSVASTPRSSSTHQLDDAQPQQQQQQRVRFMCSFGGKILPRPHDNQLRYVGGDTRIVAVGRHVSFQTLLAKLSKLAGTARLSVKYQLPSEDLDSLITVTSDEDVENMMEEYDRLAHVQKINSRLRLFLFPTDEENDINTILDGSVKRENWFYDTLNGGSGSGRVLERGRSEVSSIVSEVPDYLFGLDNNSADDVASAREGINRANANGAAAKLIKGNNNDGSSKKGFFGNDSGSVASDPGSPAPVFSSQSSASLLAPPLMPDLPPVKIGPVGVEMDQMTVADQQRLGGYSGGGPPPMWHYSNPNNVVQPAVYYVPAGGHVPVGSRSGQPVQMRAQLVQAPYSVVPPPGQVPVGYSGVGQVYGAAGLRAPPYELHQGRVMVDGSGQAVYYGVRNVAAVPGSYPGHMVVPGGDESVPEMMMGPPPSNQGS